MAGTSCRRAQTAGFQAAVDPADTAAVKAQLGRPPRGRWTVAKRCGCGLPQVIQTHPLLDDGTPFPTLWWLTCRSLCSAIGRLESQGWTAKLNERSAQDAEFSRSLEISIERYVDFREGLAALEAKTHPGGGPGRIKCLHAHVAHHLMTGDNLVGQMALDELGWIDPTRPCV